MATDLPTNAVINDLFADDMSLLGRTPTPSTPCPPSQQPAPHSHPSPMSYGTTPTSCRTTPTCDSTPVSHPSSTGKRSCTNSRHTGPPITYNSAANAVEPPVTAETCSRASVA